MITYNIDEQGNIYENDTVAQKILYSIDPYGWADLYVTEKKLT